MKKNILIIGLLTVLLTAGLSQQAVGHKKTIKDLEGLLMAERARVAELEDKLEAQAPFEAPSIDGDTAELAARIIEQEAGNQGYEGKLAVASVLVNRVNDPRFPNDLRGVITARGQFESYSSGRYARVQVSQESHKALETALAGNTSTEALYFCNYRNIGPQSKAWFDSLESLGEIKDHKFYR